MKKLFFKDSKLANVVSNLKPRVSYGVNGNVAGLGNYEVYGEYNTINNSSGIPIPYDGKVGFLNTKLVNNNLRWEKNVIHLKSVWMSDFYRTGSI